MLQHTKDWYARTAQQVLDQLSVNQTGLSQQEASQRLKQYGSNQIEIRKERPLWLTFLLQFHNVLIYVLLVSALVVAFLQQWVDTSVILGVVLINAIIGFIQENKAEKALAVVRQLLALEAIVLRDGRHQKIAACELVPGDVLLLHSGDRVPADCRLLKTHSLQVQEAPLTGESQTVTKHVDPVLTNTPLSERASMIYAGTLITYGNAEAVVVATGNQTELGHIGRLLQATHRMQTPLLKQMRRFAYHLTLAILLLAGFTVLLGILLHQTSLAELFMAAVGLAVAAIPEGLPVLITITLALGVIKMARQQAVIRLLPAVEGLGSVTMICTDKTGTLTRSEIMAETIVTSDYCYQVSGEGYRPQGEITLAGNQVQVNQHAELSVLLKAGILCNDAELNEQLTQQRREWQLVGNPTDGALLALGMKALLDPQLIRQSVPLTDLIPFESQHKFMASLHHDHQGQGFIYLKGAPETIIELCSSQLSQDGEQAIVKDYWLKQCSCLAAEGQRLLALAMRPADTLKTVLNFSDLTSDFCLLGLIGFVDPPRLSAPEAVEECRKAGIQIKMITGDYGATAKTIAEAVGIETSSGVISGQELDQMDEARFAQVARQTNVFARTLPVHKLRLVRALQQQGEVVAMTGDGVNDAPALQAANVGVAMGQKGTEAAKEAAEIVLMDDNFKSIVGAVRQGRTVYRNLLKGIFFVLPTNAGEALAIILAVILGQTLPITPVQILWINMVTAVTLGLALAFEPVDEQVMRKPPRDPRAAIFSPLLIWRIALVSVLLLIGVYGLFLWQLAEGASIELARSVAVNALVAGEIVYLLNSRSKLNSVLNWSGLTGNRMALLAIVGVICLQLLFTYWAPLSRIFQVAPLGLVEWTAIISFALGLFLLVELEKWILRCFSDNNCCQ